MEQVRELQLRLAWMEQHLGVSFNEMRKRSQNALAETQQNRIAMLPSKSGLNFKYVDDLTARIQAKREKDRR